MDTAAVAPLQSDSLTIEIRDLTDPQRPFPRYQLQKPARRHGRPSRKARFRRKVDADVPDRLAGAHQDPCQDHEDYDEDKPDDPEDNPVKGRNAHALSKTGGQHAGDNR